MDLNNISNDFLPDEKVLEKLANEYFSAPVAANNFDHFPSFSPTTQGNQSYSPSVQPANNTISSDLGQQDFSIDNPSTSLPDPHFYNGQIPSSVAGSGISPSAKSFGYGDGKQKPQNQNHNPLGKHHVFYTDAISNNEDLHDAVRQVKQYYPQSQFSSIPHTASPSSFYFLEDPVQKDYPYLNSKTGFGGASTTPFLKPPFDVNLIKTDFPILNESVNGGKRLIWLDNAATTQKPLQVIQRISEFYYHENSNIHRAAHELAARATDAYEDARGKIQRFINAASPNEIVFVRGTTEGINLVASSWGEQHLKKDDEIILSHLEHHANIVPWQLVAAKKGLKIKIIPVDDSGQIILEEYGKLLSNKTKLVSFTQVSNALGTVTPAKTIIDMAHAVNAKVLLDGAQSVSHLHTDVQYLNADWFVFSGHKIFGPTGIGVVYGKEDLLNSTIPYQGGGNMIQDVTFEKTIYQNAPNRFEAGTGNIADAVGLGAAIDYVNKLGIHNIYQYEHALLEYTTRLLKDVPGIRLIGTAADKTSVASFVLEGFKTEDVGKALSEQGVAVRSGHHCAQPILRRFGVETTVRPSIAFYNTCADIDTLVETLFRLKRKP